MGSVAFFSFSELYQNITILLHIRDSLSKRYYPKLVERIEHYGSDWQISTQMACGVPLLRTSYKF